MNYTAAEYGFSTRLIEKDYFYSVILEYFAAWEGNPLVFKGGSCLAKVHAGCYRLSEDLDFVIPTPVDASRAKRRQSVAGVKDIIAALPGHISCFREVDPFRGVNQSMQYLGSIGYRSLVAGGEETIKIEVGLREPLLMPVLEEAARTILLDPVSGSAMVPTVGVRCISMKEALAEKFRAALTRRDVAIRDFYDIDYTIQQHGLQTEDEELIELVKQKPFPGTKTWMLFRTALQNCARNWLPV